MEEEGYEKARGLLLREFGIVCAAVNPNGGREAESQSQSAEAGVAVGWSRESELERSAPRRGAQA